MSPKKLGQTNNPSDVSIVGRFYSKLMCTGRVIAAHTSSNNLHGYKLMILITKLSSNARNAELKLDRSSSQAKNAHVASGLPQLIKSIRTKLTV